MYSSERNSHQAVVERKIKVEESSSDDLPEMIVTQYFLWIFFVKEKIRCQVFSDMIRKSNELTSCHANFR